MCDPFRLQAASNKAKRCAFCVQQNETYLIKLQLSGLVFTVVQGCHVSAKCPPQLFLKNLKILKNNWAFNSAGVILKGFVSPLYRVISYL